MFFLGDIAPYMHAKTPSYTTTSFIITPLNYPYTILIFLVIFPAKSPCPRSFWICIYLSKYNSIGNIESEMFFDTDGLPTMDTHIKYGYRKEYDANEHLAAVICLDSDRNIMNIYNVIIKRIFLCR